MVVLAGLKRLDISGLVIISLAGECWCGKAAKHLVLYHSAEVVVPEKYRQFALLGCRVELTQAVIRQLGCCGLQKLLCYQTCQQTEIRTYHQP